MEDPVLFELSEIMAALKNPMLMYQVAKCPFLVFNRLSSVFFKASADKLESICQFIGTVEQMNGEFFDRAIPVFQTAVEVSNSLGDVLELLREFVFMLRAASTEFVSSFSIVYSHLLKDETTKESRKQFTNDVLKKWTASSNVAVCHNLRVPQLLCKVYNFSESPEKRCEILHRLQEILGKTKNFESPDENLAKPAEGNIKNRVACCDLEWLVFHSSLSTKEAALAFNLCTQRFQGRLKCFSFSDVEIANGGFKFVPREGGPCTDERTEGETGRERQALETNTIIFTPALVVEKIIRHLKRVIKEDDHLAENARSLWCLVCRESSTCAECLNCELSSPFHDSYIEVFLSILSQASSKEIMFYWAQLDGHHLCQCSEVILNALELSTNAFGETDKDALIEFQSLVHKAMEAIRGQLYNNGDDPCFVYAVTQLQSLCGLLKCGLSIKTISSILTLFQINERAALAARDIVSEWSNEQQAIELIEALKMRCKDGEMSSLPSQHAIFVWELLISFRRLFKNSCENVLKELEELVVLYNLGYSHGLSRLPNWRYEMLEHGVPAVAVDCWCIAFLSTPLEELTSHDVDIIVDLDSTSLELVPSVSQKIKSCLFPENGSEIALKRKKGIKEPQIKERLRLARLLRELINILKVQKLDEESYGHAIRKVVVDTCNELCEAYSYVSQETEKEKGGRENNLYKIREQKLIALFNEMFCYQSRVSYEEPGYTGVSHQLDCKETGTLLPCTITKSHKYDSLPSILKYRKVYEPLLILLRRWLSGILNKPILSSHVREIVRLLVSKHSNNDSIESMHDALQHHIMENNQALVAQLKAVGYNQSEKSSQDLWSSPAIKCSGYLNKSELGHEKKNKKLVEVLRNVWNEWKDLLLWQKIQSIILGDKEIDTRALFGHRLSLEEMEAQVSVVKKILSQIKSEDLQRKVSQMIKKEERHRSRIEEMYKDGKKPDSHGSNRDKMKKFVAVWENRFLENVKMCSEKIPGCYPPNGFHSEKPVLCALSVDNRILTVFKEEKNGRKEEMENVEVKLFEPGMYVYALHTSGHDYVTDELWAAFYKKLLEEGLVPRIILSSESPGFNWITKHNYAQAVTSLPYPMKWELNDQIVPPEEDYFDYKIHEAVFYGLSWVILTKENVSCFEFYDLKDTDVIEEREEKTRKMAGKAIEDLKNNDLLPEDTIRKLTFAIKETIKKVVEGQQVTEDMVKQLIRKKKTSKSQNQEQNFEHFAPAVLQACENTRCILLQ
ncbi:uncharacterized protein [Montipora foliosa]|uniref:uncharacterized protein n=1 Tax=Montipora foliosa TaxID=591990 RepID=UPI0035F160EF